MARDEGGAFTEFCAQWREAGSWSRNETDRSRKERITTRDKGRGMNRYVERARSAFYHSPSDTKPMFNLEVFQRAGKRWPQAAKAWLARLESLSPQDTQKVFDFIPREEISPVAINFAQTMLTLNRQRLLDLKGGLS